MSKNKEKIIKFDNILEIKGISKKEVKDLRTLCELKLQNDSMDSSGKEVASDPEHHSIDFYNNMHPKSMTDNGSFILYDEGAESHELPLYETISTSTRPIYTFSENLRKKSKIIKLVLEPKFTKYSSIRSFTSIYQDASTITWTQFSTNSEWEHDIKIQFWNCYKVNSIGARSLHQICDQVSRIVDQIPASDIYIMDDHIKAQHFRKAIMPKRVSEIIQINHQCAILFTLLQNRCIEKSQPNVFFMAYNIVGRVYDLFVGREPISTQSIIISILQSSNKSFDESTDLSPTIEVSEDIKNTYYKSYPVERECLGKSMLIGLTFIRLGLLKSNKKCFQDM